MLIKDEALRTAVAQALRVKEDEITPDKMKELINLQVPGKEIECLDGLEYAENLERLNASNNKLETLDPIRDLRNLEYLDVSINQLRDIQALHGYRQLKHLDISSNNLYTMDVSSIAAMIDLKYLNMENSKIDSIEYLEHCKKLEEVSINTENVQYSFAILGTLKQLKKLKMARMRLFNVEDLTYLSSVEELDLSTNLMDDLSPLLSMTELKKLNISNCPYIKDYSILKQFAHLRILDISQNHPDSFAFLKDLKNLEELYMELS